MPLTLGLRPWLFLCLDLFVSPLVSAPGKSGALAGWYLDGDENRLAHGQQLVVNSEDPIEKEPRTETQSQRHIERSGEGAGSQGDHVGRCLLAPEDSSSR